MKLHDDALRELGLAVIQVEAQAIADLAKQIDSRPHKKNGIGGRE